MLIVITTVVFVFQVVKLEMVTVAKTTSLDTLHFTMLILTVAMEVDKFDQLVNVEVINRWLTKCLNQTTKTVTGR